MIRSMRLVRKNALGLGMLSFIFFHAAAHRVTAEEGRAGMDAAVLRLLLRSKHSLADAIRQSAGPLETALSARFEVDDSGKLLFFGYTAEEIKGKRAIFKKVSGNPELEHWTLKKVVIKDKGELREAAKELSLAHRTKVPLLAIVTKAEKSQIGTVISAAPTVEGSQSDFTVLLAFYNRVLEQKYDLSTGNILKSDDNVEVDGD